MRDKRKRAYLKGDVFLLSPCLLVLIRARVCCAKEGWHTSRMGMREAEQRFVGGFDSRFFAVSCEAAKGTLVKTILFARCLY